MTRAPEKAVPTMKAFGVPASGMLVKLMSRVLPAAMEPAFDMNTMVALAQVVLTWHEDMVKDVTEYPESGPLGAPVLKASKLV